MLTTYNLKMPHAVYGGENAMDNITAILKANGVKRVAMFTDKGLRKLGLFDLPEAAVQAAGAEYYVLDDLPPEPSYMAVQKVVDEFKVSGADMIVACGGGSVMDAAKLASVLVTDEYGVKELLDDPGRAQKCVPIVLIPPSLKDFGVPAEDLEGLVKAGMEVQRLLVNNMRPVTPDDARRLYQEVM